EGWCRTGALGWMEDGGLIGTTDRKKYGIVTAGGMPIARHNIEKLLTADPFLSQAMVYGDRRPYPVALITLSPDELKKFAQVQGIIASDPAVLVKHPKVVERVERTVEEKNSKHQKNAKIKKSQVQPRAFN